MGITFTTVGSVRECCGHEHRTYRAARACLERDARGCAKQGGYTDRWVVVRDPEHREYGPPRGAYVDSNGHLRGCRSPADHEIAAEGWG